MGILLMFLVFVIGIITIIGSALVYQLSYWIGLKWLYLPISTHWLWALACAATEFLNLSGLFFLLSDSKNDSPNPSIIWKSMMIVSVLLSTLNYMLGLRFIKQ
ncbi:MAG: hypothetical protein R2822_18205 [Spirosomataceae bacterium]